MPIDISDLTPEDLESLIHTAYLHLKRTHEENASSWNDATVAASSALIAKARDALHPAPPFTRKLRRVLLGGRQGVHAAAHSLSTCGPKPADPGGDYRFVNFAITKDCLRVVDVRMAQRRTEGHITSGDFALIRHILILEMHLRRMGCITDSSYAALRGSLPLENPAAYYLESLWILVKPLMWGLREIFSAREIDELIDALRQEILDDECEGRKS